MNLYLNDNCLDRLSSLTSMSSSDVEHLVNNYAVDIFRSSDTEAFRLVWSVEDNAGYVLVFNPSKGVVNRVLPAQHEDGYPITLRVVKNNETRFSFVKKADIESAMRLVGEEGGCQNFIEPKLKLNRSWHYRWMIRFMTTSGPKVKSLGTTSSTPDEDEVWQVTPDSTLVSILKRLGILRAAVTKPNDATGEPPADIINLAREHLSSVSGWDGVLCLVGRDDSTLVGEWVV